MDLIGIGFIALAFAIWLALPRRDRRARREELGLPPYEETWNWPDNRRRRP